MKKLLSLLSVLTISGTAVPTTITASPYQKEETIKNSEFNLQENNLKKLKRNKRENNDKIENWYCFLCSNRLVAKISHNTWKKIADNYAKTTSLEQNSNYVRDLLSNFEKRNSSADTNAADYISDDDIKILSNVIINHFNEINDFFKMKRFDEMGLIKTNRNSYWSEADAKDNDFFWGVYLNFNEKYHDELNANNGKITKWVSIGVGVAAAVVLTGGAAAAAGGAAGGGAAAAAGGVTAYEASIASVATTSTYATAATSLTVTGAGGVAGATTTGVGIAATTAGATATTGLLSGITITLAGLGSKISAIAAKIGPTVTVVAGGSTIVVNSVNLFKNPNN